jgi:exosortase A-associated hydrolase 2
MFLPGESGQLFSLYRGSPAMTTAAVFVPSFAEEMNKSRHMFTLAAEALAVRGIGSLILDLYGTGDSAGDFADARWKRWQADVQQACSWLVAHGHRRIVLVGLRLGAMLALQVTRAIPEVTRIVLWQPVLSGESLVTQFLRTDVVARMLTQADSRSSTETLRAQLRNGDFIEVAGYTLAPDLVQALESLRLETLMPERNLSVDWIDVVVDAGRGSTPAGERVRRVWQEEGVNVNFQIVSGPPFWSSVEIAEAPELVQATATLLGESV